MHLSRFSDLIVILNIEIFTFLIQCHTTSDGDKCHTTSELNKCHTLQVSETNVTLQVSETAFLTLVVGMFQSSNGSVLHASATLFH